MIRILIQSIYYQFLMFFRIKQAVFFTIFFPIFLFIVFGSTWGTDFDDYIPFLLSGIIGMTIASDGLFAVGPVVKQYYSTGLIKYLRKLPFNILIHFSGLIISRFAVVFLTISCLCLTSFLLFGYTVSLTECMDYLFGILSGLFVFSFLGLAVAFSGIRNKADNGIVNIVYFGILFTSNAFYPVDEYNDIIGTIGHVLPLNHILSILRGEGTSLILLLWVIFPIMLFLFLFKNIKFNR